MIIIRNLSKIYGARLLFSGVDLNLNMGKRYAVIGANGAGKSTFFSLITDQEEISEGDITISKDLTIGWLQQDHYNYEHEIIINVVLQGNKKLWHVLERRYQILKEKKITPDLGYELADIEEVIAQEGGYDAEPRAEKLLLGLGIAQKYHYDTLSVLSGGYKLRVLLAQTLFNEPDILLLDEPTNYLDIFSIAWLERYLKTDFKGLLLFISHDQDFINGLATHILDIDYGEITHYVGNYDQFKKQKQLALDQKLHEVDYLERKMAKWKVFIERFRASANRSRQALSREKMLEKIELPEIKQTSCISPKFQFQRQKLSGRMALIIKGINKQFGDKKVLTNVTFSIEQGEHVAIIGKNGIGKSTLLKIVMGMLPADSGTYQWGHETSVSYIDQDQHVGLDPQLTLLEWLTEVCPKEPTGTIRATLGSMLFSHNDVFKKIEALSGGETARLLFAKVMLDKRNVIVLDEPTNHLDIDARNGLAEALNAYQGTVICVSHDRHFLTSIATRIIALTEKGIQDYKGTYQEFVQHYGVDYFEKH
jgi:ATPase subunit of ABC transporter with duplicated ATPase domains